LDAETFAAVDAFVAETIVQSDEALEACLRAAEEAGLPSIQVSPPQGKLLQILVRLLGARRVLEFGTLGGYSSILIARALPADGRLITLEAKPEFAAVARASIERAGVGGEGRGSRRPGARGAAGARGGGRRALRSRLHRRR
jgi:predicted O-methyltransferase YrrM